MSSRSNFEFVNQGPGDRKLSPQTRPRIRRQATKFVAATRKQSGQRPRVNVRQYLVRIDAEAVTVVPSVRRVDDGRHQERGSFLSGASMSSSEHEQHRLIYENPEYGLCTLNRPMPLQGIELLVSQYMVDPFDLSAMTCWHIGAGSSCVISAEPQRLPRLLSNRELSYFSHIRSRYGHRRCLDDAITCLIMRAHSVLVPTSVASPGSIFSAYGRALRSLQEAIGDPRRRYEPEVLCAMGALALFELLNSSGYMNWSQHIAGAAKLLQLRGPERFETEFDRELFVALLGPIVCQSFLYNNHCFLEDKAWQSVFLSVAISASKYSDRGILSRKLCSGMIEMPGFLRRVSLAVCQGTRKPTQSSLTNQLRAALRKARAIWPTEVLEDKGEEVREQGENERRLALFATWLALDIILSRLLGVMVPVECSELEKRVQAQAWRLQELEREHPDVIYLTQKSPIAHATLRTADIWKEASSERDFIEEWRFARWTEGMKSRWMIPQMAMDR